MRSAARRAMLGDLASARRARVSPKQHDATTTVASSGRAHGSPARYLLVAGEDRLVTVPLPASGELVIGRDATCDVQLPHSKISRCHARLIVGDETRIEDLGSTNGIRVGGSRIGRGAPARLPFGEGIRLGPYTVVMLAGGAGAPASVDGSPHGSLIVRDPTIAGASELLDRIAKHSVNVLIQGETGTGKEVLARTLHRLSGRPGELIAINCAALSGELLESELFGHERGAFTGATRTKPGLLEIAGRGTALLDEIGDLPLELQGKLLRALESRQVYRVGAVQPTDLHLRVIAATHRRLPDEVARGTFRQDLYFRLNGITLELPPLRERRAAIPALAVQFLGEAARAAGIAVPMLTPAAHAALASHSWPGNVRELRLVIERALLVAGDRSIQPAHILLSPATSPRAAFDDDRERFLAVARAHHGNTSAISRELGTSRSQVRRLGRRYDVDLDGLRKS